MGKGRRNREIRLRARVAAMRAGEPEAAGRLARWMRGDYAGRRKKGELKGDELR